ncbi:YoaK family protein [Paracoccus benzoatiresistens]|uniref:YoaK family protein n=1 Tax=Paracoccus benzoatiresistens TaxID=2997341 RepID=A0ABT4IYZ3_9RHOB|nr:YoaK family protein [Paracoccus sp. EF6]MCZ0960082.1 YoaK family protein [Paracoccus sp. EF6]
MTRPFVAARVLVSHRRSQASDFILALFLAGIAGASNAGGFFALGQYTSHMTGYLSQVADSLVAGNLLIIASALLAIAAFTTGAAFSTFLVNWARQRMGRRQFALPLAVQGACLGCFAFGGIFTAPSGRLFALACLCFIMGMQNATITKISGARIRTTHATGMITDIGIECGRALYRLFQPHSAVRADRAKLRILLSLVGTYVLGGIVGALGYAVAGFYFSLPLAALLLALAMPAFASPPRRRRHGVHRPGIQPQRPGP